MRSRSDHAEAPEFTSSIEDHYKHCGSKRMRLGHRERLRANICIVSACVCSSSRWQFTFCFFLSRNVIVSCLLFYLLYRLSERENICFCLSALYLLMLEPRVIVALKCNLVAGRMLFSCSLCDALRMFLQCVFFVTLYSLRRIESIY